MLRCCNLSCVAKINPYLRMCMDFKEDSMFGKEVHQTFFCFQKFQKLEKYLHELCFWEGLLLGNVSQTVRSRLPNIGAGLNMSC